jgi:hypothetical protein
MTIRALNHADTYIAFITQAKIVNRQSHQTRTWSLLSRSSLDECALPATAFSYYSMRI